MPRGFGRLPFIGRRSTPGERTPTGDAAAVREPIDLDLAPVGPPILLPSAILRQVLLDATELVPAWAIPRAEPAQATPPPPTESKATKRPRRPKPSETQAAKPATAKRRTRARTRDI